MAKKKRSEADGRGGDGRHRWSRRVTTESHALALEDRVFTLKDPREIAKSLKRSAEHSTQRKSGPFVSAMSMLTFYINRAGKDLPKARKDRLNRAKSELRKLYGKPEPKSRRGSSKKRRDRARRRRPFRDVRRRPAP